MVQTTTISKDFAKVLKSLAGQLLKLQKQVNNTENDINMVRNLKPSSSFTSY
jgi:hypothetical protein